MKRWGVRLSAAWIVALIFAAALADFLPIPDYNRIVAAPFRPPSPAAFPDFLGTDGIGRSILSRAIYGARVSLSVGLVSASLGLAVGGLLGLLAGYLRGWVETLVDIVADAVLALPPLLLLLALASVVRPSLATLTASLGLLVVPAFARLAKANVLAQVNREYVVAAKAMGAGHLRLLFREIVPNIAPRVLAYTIIVVPVLIVAEGSLSFLGLGIPPPTPSWGESISAGRNNMAISPTEVFVPTVILFLTVFSLNTVGNHLRQRFDVREGQL